VCAVVLTIVAANYYYVLSGHYAEDIKKCDAELMLTLDSVAVNHDVIYFGESSNTTFRESDSSRVSISELIAQCGGGHHIGTVSKGAIHAGTYRILLQRLRSASSVKILIVTMNLRSFGINWIQSSLETNLSRANVLYSMHPPVLKKFMLGFKAYDNKDSIFRERSIKWHYKHYILFKEEGKCKNVRDWDAYMFSKGHLKTDGSRDAEKCALACHFIKNYAFVISKDNPRVKDFDAIAEFCEKIKIKLIFNLLPENVERARELCGEDLMHLMKQNVKFLEERYKTNSSLVNNMELLPDSSFIDREWPTEHYNFYGRNKVAMNVAKAL
jgi:hypothetical protein